MTLKNTHVSAWDVCSVPLLNGQSLTDSIDLGGLRLFGLIIPSVWTPTDLSFQVSLNMGETWFDLRDQEGMEILVAGKTFSCLAVKPVIFSAFQYIRIRSGTTELPVNQEGDRVLQLVIRSI